MGVVAEAAVGVAGVGDRLLKLRGDAVEWDEAFGTVFEMVDVSEEKAPWVRVKSVVGRTCMNHGFQERRRAMMEKPSRLVKLLIEMRSGKVVITCGRRISISVIVIQKSVILPILFMTIHIAHVIGNSTMEVEIA